MSEITLEILESVTSGLITWCIITVLEKALEHFSGHNR